MAEKCENKELTLALSIFKGINFCVRKLGGLKSKIVCRLRDSILESDTYQLPTNSNEFELDLEAGWELSPEELKKLQEENETIKIECYLLNEAGKIYSIIGYCTISVKEAFEISIYDQIDIENLEFVPLKGAKQPWVGFGPQLQILLSLQDPKEILPGLKPKDKMDTSKIAPAKQNVERKAPLAPPSLEKAFLWSVNKEIGCFQLGNPSSVDNLYVLVLVIKEAQNLENLLNPKPSITELQNYKWLLRFNCFGREIESYNFSFNSSEENSQIYVGNKFQVCIRANEVEFNRFLSGFRLKMRIGTICNDQFELQGAGRMSLKSLTDSDNSVIEAVISMAPRNLVVVPENFVCPQISYIITVKKFCRHFEINNNCESQTREISPWDESLNVPKQDDESELPVKEDDGVRAEGSSSLTNWNGNADGADAAGDSEVQISRVSRSFLEIAEDEVSLKPPTSSHGPHSVSPPGTGDEGLVQSETNQIPNQQQRRQSPEPLGLPLDGQLVPNNFLTPICMTAPICILTTTLQNATTMLLASKTSRPNEEGDSSIIETSNLSRNSSVSSSVQTLSNCDSSGRSHLSLRFKYFCVKAKIDLEDDWIVSLVHPLLSLKGTDSNEFIAKIDGVKDRVYTFVCHEDQSRKTLLDAIIPKSSPESHPDSIAINFFSGTCSSKAAANKSSGRKDELGQNIKGRSNIYPSHSKNDSRIGYLYYESTLMYREPSLGESTSFSNSTAVDPSLDHNELFSSLGSTFENTSVEITFNSQQTSVFEISDEQFLSDINSLLKQRLKEKDEACGRLLSQKCKNQKEKCERAALAANKLEKSKALAELQILRKKEELVRMKELELADAMAKLDGERKIFEERLQEKEKESNHDILPQEVEQIVTAMQRELNISATEHEQSLHSIHEEEEMLQARAQALTVSSSINPLNAEEIIPRAELERRMQLLEKKKIKLISANEKRLSEVLQDLEIAKGQIGVLNKKLCFKDNDVLKLILQKIKDAEKKRELKNFQRAEGKLIEDLAKAKREIQLLRNEHQRVIKNLKSSNDEARLKMLSEREAELFNKKKGVNPK